MSTEEDGRPVWNEDVAESLIGAVVLVGMTRISHEGKLLHRDQFHGVVVEVDREKGVCLALGGARAGDHYWLPPATEAFERAQPGTYTLHATGEEITDPDFLTTWTLTEPPEGAGRYGQGH
jgi:hypothetical protein